MLTNTTTWVYIGTQTGEVFSDRTVALKYHLKDREVERKENKTCGSFYSGLPAEEWSVGLN